MDCSKTEIYLKERGRMTNNCDMMCTKCPLSGGNNSFNLPCEKFENKYPQKAIEIVQKWSDEHPQKTVLDDFLEKFPNVQLHKEGIPDGICCKSLGYKIPIENCILQGFPCSDCWKQPFEGFVEEN